MEWIKNNVLVILVLILLGVVLRNQYQLSKELADVQNEVNGIDNKLDYMESDINQIEK